MANRWEIIDTEITLSRNCPCGKGGMYHVTNTVQDDYGRTKKENDDPRMTCKECHERYVPSSDGWMKREDRQILSEIVKQHDKKKTQIHQTFKDNYLEHIIQSLRSLPTKKALYEVLRHISEIRTANTLETFRKHLNQYGFDFVIRGIDEVRNFKALLHLIDHFGIALDENEKAMIQEWEQMDAERLAYLKSHYIRPSQFA
ncbi:hypothetical protein [Paenibacillus sp. GXUN7292]|uniref:hypothetical protein n=1 Tax=Paenibacillus sp. GXUN7292 TaxID=3422499 RepID=UPI003D7D2357